MGYKLAQTFRSQDEAIAKIIEMPRAKHSGLELLDFYSGSRGCWLISARRTRNTDFVGILDVTGGFNGTLDADAIDGEG